METRERLPVFPVPPAAAEQVAQPTLQIDGLVAQPRTLTPADLAALARADLAEPFACEEGWSVPGLRWQGVRLSAVLALAAPLPNARYVRVRSGEYTVPVPLDQAAHGLLADWLNGEPLRLEHGAPWRLVLSGAQCFMGVKWVTHLELTAEPGSNTGEQIARARLR
ncbi:MAG: molybdopterin-dependent oxidoreductase [Chloroflexi bacterium]|nr:molybdopterin-dependent oxidoreductase [Chloroflexota bacterium]